MDRRSAMFLTLLGGLVPRGSLRNTRATHLDRLNERPR